MRFMNTDEIHNACQIWHDHAVLGPAVRTLDALMTAVDSHSDGWAYWGPPVRAAGRLMELIGRDGTAQYLRGERPDATAAELRKAYAQLRRFRTGHPGIPFRIFPADGVPGDLTTPLLPAHASPTVITDDIALNMAAGVLDAMGRNYLASTLRELLPEAEGKVHGRPYQEPTGKWGGAS
jgi:hypothetical protein